MTTRSRTALLAAVLAATVAGCSTSTGDDVAPSFPPRPVDVAVDRLDPCSTLDTAQRRAFDLREGSPGTVSVNGAPSAACTWLSNGELGYNVQTIRVPAELALTEPGAAPTMINGFGAVRSIGRGFAGGAPNCQITIDAAPGRAIRIQASAIPTPPLPTDDEMCRVASDAAAAVMTTVVGGPG